MNVLAGGLALVIATGGLIFKDVFIDKNGHITDQSLNTISSYARDTVNGYFGDDEFVEDPSKSFDDIQQKRGHWIEGPKSLKARNSRNEFQHMLFSGIEQIKIQGQENNLSQREIEEKQVDFVAQAIDKHRYNYWVTRYQIVEPVETRQTLHCHAIPEFEEVEAAVVAEGRTGWGGTLEELTSENFNSAIGWLEENSDLNVVSSSDIKQVLKNFLWSINDRENHPPQDLTKKYCPNNPERYIVQVHGEEWRNAKIYFTYGNTYISGIETIYPDGSIVHFYAD